ncbi:uncharacterized protein J3R85_014798 [Psidium guajava]|nr:uncharacterized protein J3R85_014798 [Psidium guajava]
MAGGEVLKPPKIEEKHPERRISVPRITIEEIRKHSPLMLSPRALGNGSSKQLSGRMNCLCSPTTHAGSFRCRFHRNNFIPRGHSIGSNLSELAAKSGGISDSLQAQ